MISTGLYANVHHPMYTGGLLLLFGTTVALGWWRALIISALSVPILVARIFDEEWTPSEKLAGYDNYRRAVTCRLIRWGFHFTVKPIYKTRGNIFKILTSKLIRYWSESR